jgi:hypothetical protein
MTGKRHSLPKIQPRRGALVQDWKTCGKSDCRCTHGKPHGPYYSLRWRERGRQRRTYVRAHDVEHVRAALRAWRVLHPPARSTRALLTELRHLTRDLEV